MAVGWQGIMQLVVVLPDLSVQREAGGPGIFGHCGCERPDCCMIGLLQHIGVRVTQHYFSEMVGK